MEKLLNVQILERYSKSGFINIYLNAKVLQPFNICVFFSMVQVRIFIESYFMILHNAEWLTINQFWSYS